MSSCAQCGVSPATSQCGKCKAVRFCSRDCQRLAWPWHKKRCAPPRKTWATGRAMWDEALRTSSGALIEEAVRVLVRAVDDGCDGDAARASARRTFLGYCRSDAFDFEGAAAHLERAVALEPRNGAAWRELLLVQERDLGDIAEARRVVARCPLPLWTDPSQRPGFLEPGLRAAPWWDARDFPWVAELEAMTDAVAEELADCLRRHSCWEDVGAGGRGPSGAHDGAVVDGEWKEVVVMGAGAKAGAAPKTSAFLQARCPACAAICERGGGEVVFSHLAPRSAIRAHCAPTYLRLTAHLGIKVPRDAKANCRIRVGGEWRTWTRGEALLFDDSFEHEVRNDSSESRVVLLVRFFHPDVAPERREAACRDAIAAKAAAERARWECPA